MKLIIGEQHIEYKEVPSADEVIELINENVTEGHYFSHFISTVKRFTMSMRSIWRAIWTKSRSYRLSLRQKRNL